MAGEVEIRPANDDVRRPQHAGHGYTGGPTEVTNQGGCDFAIQVAFFGSAGDSVRGTQMNEVGFHGSAPWGFEILSTLFYELHPAQLPNYRNRGWPAEGLKIRIVNCKFGLSHLLDFPQMIYEHCRRSISARGIGCHLIFNLLGEG
jgi:hypothetical protein